MQTRDITKLWEQHGAKGMDGKLGTSLSYGDTMSCGEGGGGSGGCKAGDLTKLWDHHHR